MSVPGIVQSRLDGEQVAAQVSLGGEDGLYVTRTRTLIYRADGLLSDESVEEYPHDAERIEISEGRRKSAISLDYGIDGEEKFKIPSNRLYEALHPVLAGVLNAADVTGPDETVKQTYQFSELTLVITSERVVKHVGAAVWDEDYEEFHFDDVTALDVEEGSVSSQIIIESEGRPQRIKTPSDQTREVRERIERALLSHHGASSYDEFARAHADPEEQAEAEGAAAADDDEAEQEADPLASGGVDPIDANPPELDDDGAIIEDEASVTTGDRRDDEVTADEASEAAARAAKASTSDQSAAGADAGPEVAESSESASADGDVGQGFEETTESAQSAERTTGPAATGTATTDSAATADTADGSAETADAEAEVGESSGFADSGFEPASSELERDTTEEQLAALTEAVQRQNELLAEQQHTLQQLIEELSRGR
ncbi:hypothetical protein M0R89_02335 [Halorussus limi]|uniref:DUF7115 domain-containing protein n=1 Tax=Halorussus limi TaxID=2938695 RepID=A0A8U0HW50_9EURY|nr:hypothetical protein [Halorussus limi]UPV74916.1 hypothetical protein M0R89_02335 [Halorussus limi]